MSMSPLVLLHICSATVGLLSGFMAMLFRKGSGLHGAAGSVFFVSMLCMSASAAYLAAFVRPNGLNMVVGLLTLYLVATAWRAARRRQGGTDIFDRCALLFVSAVATVAMVYGFAAANSATGSKDGMPAAAYFVFGSVALLCGVSDIRMLARGGLFGTQRIARHLWRMCLALLIATMSFFPGQARNLPPSFRATNLVYVPHVFLIGSMIYWALRVRARKRVHNESVTELRRAA